MATYNLCKGQIPRLRFASLGMTKQEVQSDE